jgi:hypothetical protein
VDVEAGGAGVLEGVVDAAVAGAGVEAGGDAGGGADGDVAGLGAQFDGTVGGLGDGDVAFLGADLCGAAEAADVDVAGGDGEVQAGGLVELDGAVRAVVGDVAETADAAEFGGGGLGLDVGAGG